MHNKYDDDKIVILSHTQKLTLYSFPVPNCIAWPTAYFLPQYHSSRLPKSDRLPHLLHTIHIVSARSPYMCNIHTLTHIHTQMHVQHVPHPCCRDEILIHLNIFIGTIYGKLCVSPSHRKYTALNLGGPCHPACTHASRRPGVIRRTTTMSRLF